MDGLVFNFKDDNKTIIKLPQGSKLDSSDLDLSFAILREGTVILVLENLKGEKHPLKIVSESDYIFGGYSYFLKAHFENSFSFIALEDTKIEVLSPEKSEELLKNHSFLLEYMKNFITNISSFLEEMTWRLDKDIEKFLAYFIIKHSKNKKVQIKNISLLIKFLNCSKSSFYNTLNQLIEDGLIEKEGKFFTILDFDGLEEISLKESDS